MQSSIAILSVECVVYAARANLIVDQGWPGGLFGGLFPYDSLPLLLTNGCMLD